MGKVILADENNIIEVAKLSHKLWPDNTVEDLLEDYLKSMSKDNFYAYLYFEENRHIAFIHLSIRYDYVNGSESSPVGYVEGIYVEPEFRHKKIATKLIEAVEIKCKELGISELGSDVLIENQLSIDFHKNTGFEEMERVVCFIKKLK